MPVNFFETELKSVQEQFNETFGMMIVCDIRTRQSVIFAIVLMGLLQKKISNAQSKVEVKPDIQRFVKTRDVLNDIFNSIENHQKERRDYDRENNEWGRIRRIEKCVSTAVTYTGLNGSKPVTTTTISGCVIARSVGC